MGTIRYDLYGTGERSSFMFPVRIVVVTEFPVILNASHVSVVATMDQIGCNRFTQEGIENRNF